MSHEDPAPTATPSPALTHEFVHETRLIRGLDPALVIAEAPVAGAPDVWLLVLRDGALVRLDLARGCAEIGGRVDPGELDLAAPLVLTVARDLAVVAIGEAKGRRAIVIEPASGRVLQRLLRDDYHPEHCRYPLALFELDRRLLLVHATEWNRLDVCDAKTGERLTERASPQYQHSARDPHYLDYFHADLRVSPDGAWLVDLGWVWGPWGVTRGLDLRRWLRENPWESEDGPSAQTLAQLSDWGTDAAWLDARTVALWGIDDSNENAVRGARIVDVASGDELATFAGPAPGLASCAGTLIAFAEGEGTTAWDWREGAAIARDPSFVARGAHPTTGAILSFDEGRLRRSSLRKTPA